MQEFLNILSLYSSRIEKDEINISKEVIENVIQRKNILYDKAAGRAL